MFTSLGKIKAIESKWKKLLIFPFLLLAVPTSLLFSVILAFFDILNATIKWIKVVFMWLDKLIFEITVFLPMLIIGEKKK